VSGKSYEKCLGVISPLTLVAFTQTKLDMKQIQ
jgi:hypothetical protein